MPRSDRLFDLIQILRDGRLHRGAEMARRLGVSDRTIWRDMATLMQSGMPVEGERGVGYILRAPITLPPMMLSTAEMEALRLGMRLVAEGGDAGLARAARALSAKIAAVTPQPVDAADDLFVFTREPATRAPAHMPMLRGAIRKHERVTISYLDLSGQQSHRDIRPLHLDLQGKVWTLAAYCEAHQAFRAFRVDRILALTPTDEIYPAEPGRMLRDYKVMQAEQIRSEQQETQNSDPVGS